MKTQVKLGHSVPLSGEEGTHGIAADQAVQLAVQQANERGDLPFELVLLSLDDECSEEAGAQVARQFCADPDVFAVVGPFNSVPTLGAGPVFDAAGMAHICPAASNPGLSRQGWRTFFRVIASDDVQGREAAKCAVHVARAGRIAVLHDKTAFGQPLAEIVADEAKNQGAEIVLFEGVDRGQRRFPDTARRIREIEPDLIYYGLIEAEGSAMAHELRAAGVTAPYMGADGLKPSRYLETPEVEVVGPYYTSASASARQRPSAASFNRAYAHAFPDYAGYSIYTVEAYDAANILIDALRRSGVPDRAAILAQVAATAGFAGASGSITFSPVGERLNPVIDCYVVEQGALTFLGATADLLK